MSTLAQVTVSAANLCDATGTTITSAQIIFQPALANGTAASFKYGGTTGGQVSIRPVIANVVNGVFSLILPDVTQTSPENVGFLVSCVDNVSGTQLLGPGYFYQPGIHPANFDLFSPNLAAQVTMQYGPQGIPGTPGKVTDVALASGVGNLLSLMEGALGLAHVNVLDPTLSKWQIDTVINANETYSTGYSTLAVPPKFATYGASSFVANCQVGRVFFRDSLGVTISHIEPTNPPTAAGTAISIPVGTNQIELWLVYHAGSSGVDAGQPATTAGLSKLAIFLEATLPTGSYPFQVTGMLSQITTISQLTPYFTLIPSFIAQKLGLQHLNVLNTAGGTVGVVELSGSTYDINTSYTGLYTPLPFPTFGAPYLVANFTIGRIVFLASDSVTVIGHIEPNAAAIGVAVAIPVGTFEAVLWLNPGELPQRTGANYLPQYEVFLESTLPTGVYPFALSALRPLIGKVAFAFGDSIFAMYNSGNYNNQTTPKPPQVVCDLLGMTLKVNDAVPGRGVENYFSSYPGGVSNGSFTTSGNSLATDLAGVSYVLCQGGGNDLQASGNYGSYSDTSGTASLAGYIRNFCETILTANPNVKIVFLSPYDTFTAAAGSRPTNNTIGIASLAAQILPDYGGSVIDMRSCGINRYNAATANQGDGIHLTAVGRDTYYAPYAAKQLQNATT